MISIGLSWREAIPCVALSFVIISIPIVLNGIAGSMYHVPFPVLSRSSWGFWGSYIPILSRVILAMFWFGIQTYNGAECVQQMITAIWPSFERFPNHIPASEGITSAALLSFFIFWVIQFPFLLMHPNTLRWLFLAKSIIVPICAIGMLIWAFKETGGGPIFSQKATLHGSARAWAFLASMTSTIGNYATLSVNIADFSRYSRVPHNRQLVQLALPIIFTFLAFIGIAVASATQTLYGGPAIWDPAIIISKWDNRAAKFFAAFAWGLASLGVNISANSVSAANDLTALFPRFVNIRRGQILCAVLGAWALVPWKILESAISFLNFMAAYAVFLGPIAAIMIVDFWIIHKTKLDIVAMYHPQSIYVYSHGVNMRAVVAFIIGVAPNLPGFIQAVNPKINAHGGTFLFDIAWLLGFVLTFVTYWVINLIWPATETILDKAVLPDDVYLHPERDWQTDSNGDMEKEKSHLGMGMTSVHSVHSVSA
ncbi:hypothetical protein SISNIDRAFT_455091 [Sistotremastrum niveocremeum HHB9708]|uniref:NCS1 nucleoside transporter family n=2 Tax=Sistotremastraceae TaxID=3402574 RepID=A0A164UCX4_9AGAM|nr:hypothetical protein SISNIDRAFT_455091 [Sistotremastrum niveocremeum HHB9708]KZT40063.1 hypothetical protein SISSUDRAFT_1044662 [Sistotremastrum suecicum HHB10207 ss-3]